MGSGAPPGAADTGESKQLIAFLNARNVGPLKPGPLWDPTGHVFNSLHHNGRAIDFPCSGNPCDAIYDAFLPLTKDGRIEELLYGKRGSICGGRRCPGPDSAHMAHVHVGMKGGADLGAGVPGEVSEEEKDDPCGPTLNPVTLIKCIVVTLGRILPENAFPRFTKMSLGMGAIVIGFNVTTKNL